MTSLFTLDNQLNKWRESTRKSTIEQLKKHELIEQKKWLEILDIPEVDYKNFLDESIVIPFEMTKKLWTRFQQWKKKQQASGAAASGAAASGASAVPAEPGAEAGVTQWHLWADTRDQVVDLRSHCPSEEFWLQALGLEKESLQMWIDGEKVKYHTTQHLRHRLQLIKATAASSAVSGPAASGSAASGSAASGSATSGPAASGLAASGPAASSVIVINDDKRFAHNTNFEYGGAWVRAVLPRVDSQQQWVTRWVAGDDVSPQPDALYAHALQMLTTIFPHLEYQPIADWSARDNFRQLLAHIEHNFGLPIHAIQLTYRRDKCLGQQNFRDLLRKLNCPQSVCDQEPVMCFHGSTVHNAHNIQECGFNPDQQKRAAFGFAAFAYWSRGFLEALVYALQARLTKQNEVGANKMRQNDLQPGVCVSTAATGNCGFFDLKRFKAGEQQQHMNAQGHIVHTRQCGPGQVLYIKPMKDDHQVCPEGIIVIKEKIDLTQDQLKNLVNNEIKFLSRQGLGLIMHAHYQRMCEDSADKLLNILALLKMITEEQKAAWTFHASQQAAQAGAAQARPQAQARAQAPNTQRQLHHPYRKPPAQAAAPVAAGPVAAAPVAAAPVAAAQVAAAPVAAGPVAAAPVAAAPVADWKRVEYLPIYGLEYDPTRVEIWLDAFDKHLGYLYQVSKPAWKPFQGKLVITYAQLILDKTNTVATASKPKQQPARSMLAMRFAVNTEEQQQVRLKNHSCMYPNFNEFPVLLEELGWEKPLHVGLKDQFVDLRGALTSVIWFCAKVGFPGNPDLPTIVELCNNPNKPSQRKFSRLEFRPEDYEDAWKNFESWQASDKWLGSAGPNRPASATDTELQALVDVVIFLADFQERHRVCKEYGLQVAHSHGVMTEEEAKTCWGALRAKKAMLVLNTNPEKRDDLNCQMLFQDTMHWLNILLDVTDYKARCNFAPRSKWQTTIEDHARIFGGQLKEVFKFMFGTFDEPAAKKDWLNCVTQVRKQILIFLQYCEHKGCDINRFHPWNCDKVWNDKSLRECLQTYTLEQGVSHQLSNVSRALVAGGAPAAGAPAAGAAAAGASANVEPPSKKPKT